MGFFGIVRYILFTLLILFIVPSLFLFFNLPVEQYGIFVLWVIALLTFFTFLNNSSVLKNK